jgi:hypothetical protein
MATKSPYTRFVMSSDGTLYKLGAGIPAIGAQFEYAGLDESGAKVLELTSTFTPSTYKFLRPDGTSLFLRPDGTSDYLRP